MDVVDDNADGTESVDVARSASVTGPRDTCQSGISIVASDATLPIGTVSPRQSVREPTRSVSQFQSVSQHPSYNDALAQDESSSFEQLSWSENMNWLPVSNGSDLAVLEDFDLTATFNGSAWTLKLSEGININSPLTSTSSSTDLATYAHSRRKDSESRYVDGHGARKSVQRIKKLSTVPVEVPWLRDDSFSFPQAGAQKLDVLMHEDEIIDERSYNIILRHFRSLCVSETTLWKPFDAATFPERSYLNHCMSLYLEQFAPHVALLHNTFWTQRAVPWPVLLACITIGSTFDEEGKAQEFAHSFREFLRRVVRWCLETDTALDRMPLAQTCLLHTIAQFNASSEDNALSAVCDLRLAMSLYQTTYRAQPLDQIDPSQTELLWAAWVQEEMHQRLQWFTWLTEMILSAARNHVVAPTLPTNCFRLPCATILWNADNIWTWNATFENFGQGSGLLESLNSLYIKHRVPDLVDTIQNVLLTYAIVARTGEVASTVQQALHSWNPTPADGDNDPDRDTEVGESAGSKDQWLPANSTFATWRNSACDCFDLLHWQANSEIHAAKGFEGPAVLHLHLARLLLLCPYRDCMSLVSELSRRHTAGPGNVSAAQLTGNMIKWLTLDDHKGRLSLVHAGAIFWYIRRYSLALHHEPFTIYVAAVILWTYALYLPQVRSALLAIKDSRIRCNDERQNIRSQSDSQTGSSEESEDDDLIPDTILIDRPCDDEIIQAFVRKGHAMTVEMSGAGDICTARGLRRVLEEGIKLLQRSQYISYDKAREYSQNLHKLTQRI
ncbi:putative C2H2 transcription factor [Cercospora zeina]